MPVEVVREKVQRFLTAKLGSVEIDSDGDFVLRNESAAGFVTIIDWGNDKTIVRVWSPVLREVGLTADVYKWVATDGQENYFGHAHVVTADGQAGMIVWEHELLGDYLDEDELMIAVYGVVGVANDIDDDLKSKFGGKLASE
jgi:hypothetical protein